MVQVTIIGTIASTVCCLRYTDGVIRDTPGPTHNSGMAGVHWEMESDRRSGRLTLNIPSHPLSAIALFAELDRHVLDGLMNESRVRRFPRGQVLCHEGDPGDDLMLLERGRVKVCRFAAGREVVLAEVEAPTAFGELALIDGSRRAATLIALTDVQIRILGRQPVISLLESRPQVGMAMLRSLVAMVRSTNDQLADVLSLDVPARLANWLLAQASETDTVVLAESQESLGFKLGTTRVTINRALQRFERTGLIRRRGTVIELVDRAALASIGEG